MTRPWGTTQRSSWIVRRPLPVAPWHPPAPIEAVRSSDAPLDVTPWHPPAEVSALSTRSAVSYPTAESSSQPFPGVAMHHDPWNYHAATADDDAKLVEGVADGDSSTMSLSSVSSSMMGSNLASTEDHQERHVATSGNLGSDAAALSSVFDKRAPSTPEWEGSSLTGDRIVPVHVAPIPQEPREAEAQPSPDEWSQ